jgi:hypothetical protein
VNSDFELSDSLVARARDWQTYQDETERRCRCTGISLCPYPHTVEIRRCSPCGEEIYPDDLLGILRHLTTSHGYRMDGRQFDNQNREITNG